MKSSRSTELIMPDAIVAAKTNGAIDNHATGVFYDDLSKLKKDFALFIFPKISAGLRNAVHMAQWIRRPPTEREIPSSSLGLDTLFLCENSK